MFKLLSGVLQLGNVEFMTAGGAQITTKQGQCKARGGKENSEEYVALVKRISVHLSVVTNASELLGLDAFQLSEVMTQRSIILRGEEICSPLTIEQVSIHIHANCCSPPGTSRHTLMLSDPYRPWIPGILLPWRYIPSVFPGSS